MLTRRLIETVLCSDVRGSNATATVHIFPFCHVRYWPFADILTCTAHVRFGGKADMTVCGKSAFVVAIGGRADVPFFTAYVR
jgi:hypothetical protein